MNRSNHVPPSRRRWLPAALLASVFCIVAALTIWWPAALAPRAMPLKPPPKTPSNSVANPPTEPGADTGGLTAEESALPSSLTAPPQTTSDGYRELDWSALMPPDDLVVFRDQMFGHEGTERASQFGSFKVVEALDGIRFKLPGYVVPVELDANGKMREFFFVPYFGACIHVPPPPPNQLLHVKLLAAIPAPEIWDAQWLKGVLRARRHDDPMASAAYSAEEVELTLYDG